MAHLADGLLAELLPEPLVAPVFAHARVDEVLVHGGELGRENVVEQRDDLVVALHARAPAGQAALRAPSTSAVTMW